MKRVIIYNLFLLGLLACNGNSETSIDDLHRPVDWSAEWVLSLEPDTSVHDHDVLRVVDFKTDKPIQQMVDELYQLAFSGEAKVFSPGLFGEMDNSNQLDPKALLEALKRLDTVTVEDIYTGESKDTVVDNSFSLSKTSAVVLTLAFENDVDGFNIQADHIAYGLQVFDPITGKSRGDAKRFFIDFTPTGKYIDHLKIYTDSLGNFVPSHFEVYPDETQQSLKSLIKEKYGENQLVTLRMKVAIDFKVGQLFLTEAEVLAGPNAS